MAVGLTVIVNVNGVPIQSSYLGVTSIVAVTGAVLGFIAVKDGRVEPVPLATRPIAELLFFHVYVTFQEGVAVVSNGIDGT